MKEEVIGFLITLTAFWHVGGFAFGLIHVHFSLKSLLALIPYDKAWTRIIRSADLHLWLSGFTLIGLGICQRGLNAYITNPKLWCKITVVVIWFLSTQTMRLYAIPKLKLGNQRTMLRLASINIACWIYGAILGCAKPLSYSVWPYHTFLAGFVVVIVLCFLAISRISFKRLIELRNESAMGISEEKLHNSQKRT